MKNKILSKAYGGVTEARHRLYGLGLPRQWKVITSTLLLLFTFAIGNVMAQLTPALPATTLTLPTIPTEGWKGEVTPTYYKAAGSNVYVFCPYELYKSVADLTWTTQNNGGNASPTLDALAPFPASSVFTGYKAATLNGTSKGPYAYRVTNCVKAYVRCVSGSNKKRTITLAAYEIDGEGNVAASAAASDTYEANSDGVISIDLNMNKEYYIKVSQVGSGSGGSSSGNSTFYMLGLQAPYKVTLDPDGGSYPSNTLAGWTYDNVNDKYSKYVAAGSLTLPSAPSKGGYDFTEWQDNKANAYTTSITIDKDTVLTAQWIAAGSAYDVNIASMTNGSVVASPASQVEDGIVTLTVTPDDGYLLSSLSVVGDVSGDEVTVTANQFTMPAEDVTVNATFSLAPTYTVTLNPAGGTIADATGWTLNAGNYEKEVAEGTVLTLPTFTKEGRTFKTWRKAGPADVASPVTVDGDLSLTAIWTATIEQGIYSWESPDGTPIEVGGTAKFYNGDTDASSTAAPDNRVNYANKPVSGDDVTQYYTLRLDKAVDYSAEHVRISLNSALKEGDKIAITAYYTKEQAKTVAPKIANGSNEVVCSADNLANLYNGGTPVTQTKTLNDKAEGATTLKLTRSATSTTAFITKLQIIREVQVEEGDLLTVTFDANGGSAVASAVVASGQTVAKPADPTWAKHRFNEWQLSGSTYNFSSPVTSNITLVANWTQLYTISFAAGEGSGDAPAAVADKAQGETFTVPANTYDAPTGKVFAGWNDGSADYAEGDTYTVGMGNVVLTAQWVENSYEAKIGTTFYATFAEAIAAVAAGQTIQLLADCSYDAAWNLTLAGTVTLDLNGHDLTYNGSGRGVQVHDGAKLVLEDGTATTAPTIDLTADPLSRSAITYTSGTFDSKDGMAAINGGEIEINSGRYLATEGVILVKGNGATATVNDGVLISRDNGVLMGNGTNSADFRNYVINVHGGILLGEIVSTGYASMVIYHPNVGELNIDGGTLVSTNGPAVVCRGGESNITGGTIVAQGSGSGKCGDASLVLPAVGVAYDFKSAYPGVSSFDAKISGDANVSGEAGAVKGIYAGTTPTTAEEDAVAISGGTFNSPVAQALCAENYAPNSWTDGTGTHYGVKPLAVSIDFEALATTNGSGTTNVAKELGDHNYTFSGSISTDNGASWDVATAAKPADKGLKIKGADGVTLSFDVAAGKLVTLKVGSLKGSAQISKNGGEFVTLTGADPLSTGASVYTYYYDAAQASYVIKANGTDYHVLQSIKIEDPYEVSYNTHGGDPIAEQYFYGTAITLPTPTYGTQSFKGWYDAETGGNLIGAAGASYTPTGNIELHAQWETVSTDARLASISFSSDAGTLSPAFNPEVVNYTYTMPYGTADVPTITGATKANPAAKDPVIDAQAAAWGETAHVHGVAASDDTKDYYVQMLRAPKDGVEIIGVVVTGNTEGTVSGLYKGTASIKLNNKKLDNGDYYIYVTLKEGYTFEENDVLIVDVNGKSDLSGGNKALEITTGVGNIDGAVWKSIAVDDYATGENTISLAGIAAGQTSIGLKRSTNQNAKINGLRVLRPMNPVLKKVTVAGVDGAPDNTNHVAIEVPASTADAALDAITYDWVSNSDAWTAAHAPVVANTWEFGVENTVTFTDKDGDASVYYVTISKAVPSSDATLATLTYGTPATAIALADGVFEYNVELPYGTSAVPTLAATAHHAGANVTDIDDAAAFVNRHATSTVTVKAEDNTTTQLYTVNFTVSRFESKVLWNGATMTQMSDITAAATAAGVSVTTTGVSVTSFSAVTCEENGKSYTRALDIGGNTKNSRYFGIVIPDGKVAKVSLVYRAKGTGARSIIIGTALTGTVDESTITSIACADDATKLHIMTAEMFGGGTLYINTTDGFHVHEISIQLAAGHGRSAMLGAGVLGTVCVPNNVTIEDIQGVTVYELMGRESQYGKLAFDEIISGELEAGVPYVFQAHRNHMALLYGETHVANPVDKHNGMYGTFTEQTLTELNDVYYFAQKALWGCADLTSLKVPANRAYVKLSEVGSADPNPAPGRRRISMAVNGEQIATGIENTGFESEAPRKVLINGELFIIRGEKIYDAKGQLVK